MAEFHFLRPLWLALIPVGLVLAWCLLRARSRGGSWVRLIEPQLHKHVLVAPEVLRERRWPLLSLLAATVLAGVALAGPTWERLPVPVYRSQEALVVALDLSRSMDATDLEPSRLARAKLKLLALLERRAGGEMALVVFSAHAFTVTPLTTDNRTIAALVSSLFTSIMPSQGSRPEAGLEKAAQLLRQAGVPGGEILLISDATVGPDAFALVDRLRGDGIRTSVLAVGTEEGAPIPDPAGGFLTDGSGQVVVPALKIAGLRRLAQTGGGRFAQLAPDERDLAALFPAAQSLAGVELADQDDGEYEADIWRDQGMWLAVLLLPFAAFAFRRGWIVGLVLAVALMGAPVRPSYAFEWIDLWKRPDRQGAEALARNEPAAAAELFEDPSWRGVAEYRAESFSDSAATLASDASALGLYNRGNALARSGQLEQAIESYDRALELDPENEDARYNRDLLAELLEQQNDQQQQEQDSGSGSGEQSADAADSSEQPDGSESQQAQASSDSSNSSSPSDDEASESQSDSSEDRGDQQNEASADDQQPDQPLPESRALPEDIEQWASDQAADQWLRRVPQDPGGLLRRKFLYQYQRLGLDQDGNYVWPGDEAEPW